MVISRSNTAVYQKQKQTSGLTGDYLTICPRTHPTLRKISPQIRRTTKPTIARLQPQLNFAIEAAQRQKTLLRARTATPERLPADRCVPTLRRSDQKTWLPSRSRSAGESRRDTRATAFCRGHGSLERG